MYRLSETASRILAELEEAQEENISSLTNTVLDVFGYAGEIEDMQSSIVQLINLNLVLVAFRKVSGQKLQDSTKTDSLAVANAITDDMAFDNAQKLWLWGRDRPRAYLVTTPDGLKKSREILGERGYKWWRPRTP